MLKKLQAVGIGVVVGALAFMVINVAMGRPLMPGPRRPHEAIVAQTVNLDPVSLYTSSCAPCHQAQGQGVPGAFPPLAGSSWVTDDAATPIRVMLVGIGGELEVAGTTYNGMMPPQTQLNDEQIAIVTNYIRSSFGNEAAEPIDAAFVQNVKAGLNGRTTPWAGGAELAAAAGQ